MAEKRPEKHKRSRSSLALSMLHRDRSKTDDKNDDASSAGASDPASASGSPTTFQGAFSGYLKPSRQKPQAQEHGGLEMKSGVGSDGPHSSISTGLQGGRSTIEQSVRMFRLFEILRSSDHATIAKAVSETSTKPSVRSKLQGPGASLEGTTILHLAVQCAEPQVVEHILSISKTDSKIEIDINAQDRTGNGALHLASMLGRSGIVRTLLLQPGIDSSLLNYQGRSPLDLARNPEIFQQLQMARSVYIDVKVKSIQKLISQGNYDDLESLLEDSRIEAVLDINGGELVLDPDTIESGGTLLHEAARKRDLRLTKLLLLHGADPFRRDRKGKLPQDVTKDEKTRALLKKSPAATVAQRNVQEKSILGNPRADNALGGRESREIKGYLKKWTNYTTGYKLRWFVLDDGVLSYYKHQDDAGSACRGAINMRIAGLFMDASDKTRFEIQGKSSVKYHLKANHVVEAKRWFWALNNAIQWAKDEAKDDAQKKTRDVDALNQAKIEQAKATGLSPATAVGITSYNTSCLSFQEPTTGLGSSVDGDQEPGYVFYEPSVGANDLSRIVSKANTVAVPGDLDDEEEYGDDASSHDIHPSPKDAFNITANSANLQLELLGNVSTALQSEISSKPSTTISDPAIAHAVATYEGAVRSLQSMVGDLLKIARDRDAYWQYRVDREADMRKLWEDSMTKVAKEQEELEGRIGESEEKRKRTKRALREALDAGPATQSLSESAIFTGDADQVPQSPKEEKPGLDRVFSSRRKSLGVRDALRQKSVIATMTELSDSDSEADEEFFDAVDAGEVEVLNEMPLSTSVLSGPTNPVEANEQLDVDGKAVAINSSFKGYEESVRQRLNMTADDRPKISLWGILKSMIGKDMTKMTLPVSFNEPTSLLQRVAEDMEYTDLLDTASERADSTERLVYVAAFAASEYASTIGRVAKPFNPLLGETYEYARPDKGYRFFIEQVSHHPPIGAAWAESARWDYYGESAVKSKFYGKSFDINPLGTWFLKLRPASGGEELYTWKKVTSSVIGIITGSPTVDNYGPMEVKNWTTGEVCILDFKPRGWKVSSAYQVSGKVLDADGKPRWSIGGRWNDKIYARLTPGFETEVTAPTNTTTKSNEPNSLQAFLVWEAHSRPTGIPFNLTPFVVTLNALPINLRPILPPTDTRLRPDQRAMEDGQYDFAATEKNRVEEKQRAKRREMEANGEEFVPKWFSKGKCDITGEEYWVSNGEYWGVREKGGWERKGVEDIF